MASEAVVFTLCILYAFFISWCYAGWIKNASAQNSETPQTETNVTVLVPVRNEESNIRTLLESLRDQDYPSRLFEIIVIDDFSTDKTASIAADFFSEVSINGRVINSGGSSKKDALHTGVMNSNNNFILCTDGDCIAGNGWISSFVDWHQRTGSVFQSGPVVLTGGQGFLQRLQQLEMLGLSVIGAGAISNNMPMICNGANLAFTREAFIAVGGYQHSSRASGDDTQLMLKMNGSFPGRVTFVKDNRSIVRTPVLARTRDVVRQRKRWASKIPGTLTPLTVSAAIVSWLVHALLLMLLAGSLFCQWYFILFLPAFVIKVIPEIMLIRSSAKFFAQKISLPMIIFSQPLYWLYVVVIGIAGPAGSYEWKGRKQR